MKIQIILFAAVSLVISSLAQAAPYGMYYTHQQRSIYGMLGIATPKADASQKLVYYGGPVISNVKVYSVMWGSAVDATTQKQIGDFYKNMVNSTYMDWLTEYNTSVKAVDGRQGTNQTIGRGSYVGQIVITPANKSTSLDDKDIQAELDQQIANKALPLPDENTIFMIHFPPGVSITVDGQASCQVFCAYHMGFVSKNYGNVYYGVMPDLGGACSFGCGFQPNLFDDLTEVSSHELIEAVTDPFPTPGNTPAYPQAWNTTDGNEIGDLCAGNATQLTGQGINYVLQQEFDNASGQCAPGPYSCP